jgi:taurine---2-oxoglutarate transaminase
MTSVDLSPVATDPDPDRYLANAYANDRQYVFHSWSAQGAITPTVIAGASGSRMWDDQGNTYLDFSCQLVNTNIGHQHPKMVAAIQQQAARLCTIAPSMANDMRSEAARLIVERAPGDLEMVFFTNGGAEAVENAIRMAKLHTGRQKVLSMYRSYHGATSGAISVTGEARRHDSEPGMPGAVKFFGPYLYRSAFHATTEQEECERALAHLRNVVLGEGADRVAAIIVESVPGTNGILVPPPGYLAGVRALCDEFGIVMIADEVMAGFGRCGEWFAIDHWGVTPDLITFAKGVNSGYVPLGGVAIKRAIADTFRERVYQGGLTYSGHPLACAAAVASINIFTDEGIIDNARMIGDTVLGPRLRELAAKHDVIGEVRGLGVFWAMELVSDAAARTPADLATMQRFVAGCKQRGVWPFMAANRIHVVPPCNVSVDDAHAGLDVMDEVLATL